MTNKIRVLLADDQDIIRTGLTIILNHQPDLEVIGQAADGIEAVDMARQLHPDVILMDIKMPRLNGIQATRRSCRTAPDADHYPHHLRHRTIGSLTAFAPGPWAIC